MSKAHIIVLSFLKAQPYHGYQIGQMVERFKLPEGSGITLQAIYKAIQSLEKQRMISGKEMRDGNNPPRMVYHLKSKGGIYLRQLILDYLQDINCCDHDWWTVLHFARGTVTREELSEAVKKRITNLKERCKTGFLAHQALHEHKMQAPSQIHKLIGKLGTRTLKAELKTLAELEQEIEKGEDNDFYL